MKENQVRRLIEDVFSTYFVRHALHPLDHPVLPFVFGNQLCSFVFSCEYENVEFNIWINERRKPFSIFLIYRAIHDKHWSEGYQDCFGLEGLYRKQLEDYRNFLEKYLPSLPEGDFSWIERAVELDAMDRKVLQYVYDLDYNDPVYQKYRNNDPTWYAEVVERLNRD